MLRAAGLLTLALALSFPAIWPARADQAHTYVIEVSEVGFNPPVCLLSRGDAVLFKNAGSQPRHIVGIYSNGLVFYDSGTIVPGATSGHGFSNFDFPNHWQFSDVDNPVIHGVAITPTNSNTQDPDCSPDPAARPPQGTHPTFDCTTAICLHAASISSDG